MERISIDIETIPLGASFGEPKEMDSSAQEHAAICVNGESVTDDEVKKLSLDATSSRIVALAIARFDENSTPKGSVVWYGDSESQILNEFWKTLATAGGVQLIAHNGLNFDLPFIWRRSVILNIKPSRQFNLARYRTDPIYDTLQVWANWNIRDYVGLNRLSTALGLGSKSGSGDQVLGLWLEGRFSEVARYCLRDALLTYACFCRMSFMPLPDLDATELACSFHSFEKL